MAPGNDGCLSSHPSAIRSASPSAMLTFTRRCSERGIRAQEEERRRVAREVHDEPAQALIGLLMRLDKMEQRFATTGRYDADEFEQSPPTLRQAPKVPQKITIKFAPR